MMAPPELRSTDRLVMDCTGVPSYVSSSDLRRKILGRCSGISGFTSASVGAVLATRFELLLPNQLPGFTRLSRHPEHPASVSEEITRSATRMRMSCLVPLCPGGLGCTV